MNSDRLETLLQNADDSAPKCELRAPRLADLEHRRRLQIVRRGGALLLIAGLAASAMWISALRDRHRLQLLHASAESLDSSLAELEDVLGSLRTSRPSAVSEASEGAALATFRALHRGADRGDEQSLEGMRWLAERFATTRGGRCAQLFLTAEAAERPAPHGTKSSGNTDKTKP